MRQKKTGVGIHTGRNMGDQKQTRLTNKKETKRLLRVCSATVHLKTSGNAQQICLPYSLSRTIGSCTLQHTKEAGRPQANTPLTPDICSAKTRAVSL